MVFCWVIGEVGGRRFPVNVELSLAYSIFHPIKPHIGAFEISGFHGFIDNATGSGVVGLNRCRRLRVPHVE